MAEPAVAEAPECTPYDPAIVGPPAPDACEPAAASTEAPEDYVYMGTGEADPTLAYGHFAEDEEEEQDADFDPAEVGVDPDPADYGYDPQDAGAQEDLPELSDQEREQVLAKPVDDMDDTEFSQVLAQKELDPEQMQKMLDATSASPERKLELWKKLHVERNAAQMEEACPESEVGEDPDRMKERMNRETTQEATKDELAIETDALPANYTVKDVEELIARKEKEHQIEQEYGINLTAQKELRANGSRVMWSDRELDDIKVSMEQIPPELLENHQVNVNEVRREETVLDAKGKPDNAQCGSDGTIRVGDIGADVGDLEERQGKTEEFEAEHGYESNHLERVFLHELGHAVNYGDPETQKIHEEQWKTLPGNRKGSGEYFAEDFHHALNAPEQFYEDSIYKPQEAVVDAQKAFDADPSMDNKAKLATAEAEAKAYPEMYANMRNKVFHTNEKEDEIAARLEDQGYPPEYIQGFRALAQQSSTPDQLEIAAEKNGYTDENGAPT